MDWAWFLPGIIFFAEAVVVTTSTIRVIFISRGKRALAAVLGFGFGNFWHMLCDQVAEFAQQLGAFRGRCVGPSGKSLLGCMYCGMDFLFATSGYLG